jgi:hypothetical protein
MGSAHSTANSDSSSQGQRRIPEEKGPFGKARKRGLSRSKTSTPARSQDQAKLENLRVIDDIFSRTKDETQKRESVRARKPSGTSAGILPLSSSSVPNLIDAGGLSTSLNAPVKDPTEVMIFGYGNDVQWAAIDYYERVSMGIIYEDYDRQPPHTRYNLSLSQSKSSSLQSLSRTSIRRINEYIGGEHWIKVTFDSPEAAERACHYSPHVIQGYIVYAQRYVGRAPDDVPIRASGSSAVASLTGSPNTISSTTMPPGTSSTTLSSATATNSVPASMPPRLASEPLLYASGAFPFEDDDATIVPSQQPQVPNTAKTTAVQRRQPGQSSLRIKNAKPAVLLPSEKAFRPAASRWQQTFGHWPIIGWVVGTNHGIIGDQVPRKEDGTFDSASASLYWRMWYSVDSCLGTDFCGVRDAEYEAEE